MRNNNNNKETTGEKFSTNLDHITYKHIHTCTRGQTDWQRGNERKWDRYGRWIQLYKQ